MTRINCWLDHSCKRVYPNTPASRQESVNLAAARGERVSFLACVKNPELEPVTAAVEVGGCDALQATIRRVGYVPMEHLNTSVPLSEIEGLGYIPGLVPDPLFPENSVLMGAFESHSFWITVEIPEDIEPGAKKLTVSFSIEGAPTQELALDIEISPMTIKPRKDFPVTHWFYADALCDWYKVEPFDEGFWAIVKPYMKNLIDHGNNCIYTPIFTPPTDGVKRPTQLLKVSKTAEGKYQFDFSDVLRWIKTAESVGAEHFEWTHLFSQGGVQYAIRVYLDNADPKSLLWPAETLSTDNVYREFLSQFLPAFHEFLTKENLVEKSFFHLSDEPHGEESLVLYRKARAMLKELAPWMKVMDALSEIEYGREGLSDIPIPIIDSAQSYIDEGIPSWVYFCCGPRGRYLNRLMDTPLAQIRMAGWLFYKLRAQGFLHWGFNYWYKRATQRMIDPFTEQAGCAWKEGWPYGDTFVVYPGEDGPIDSIRWEVFAESLQDYALLQSAGIDPDAAFLSEIKSYEDFPKYAEWISNARREALFGCASTARHTPKITAHRGASDIAPENTLVAINMAWEHDADAVEIDVHLTKDNHVIVMHDANTLRTCGVDMVIAEHTLAELRELDAGKWKGAEYAGEKIPTLEEALATIPEGKLMLVEIKCGPEITPEFVRIFKESGKSTSQVVATSFSADVIRAVKEALPEISTRFITSTYADGPEGLVKIAREVNAIGFDLHGSDVVDREFLDHLKRSGFSTCAWTIDDPERARHFTEIGIEWITTNRAKVIMTALRG